MIPRARGSVSRPIGTSFGRPGTIRPGPPTTRPTPLRPRSRTRFGSMTPMSVDRPPVRRPRAGRLLAALAGLFVGLSWVLLGPAAPASAHAALVGSDPANGAIVPDAPNKVTLSFSESVQLIPGKIQV